MLLNIPKQFYLFYVLVSNFCAAGTLKVHIHVATFREIAAHSANDMDSLCQYLIAYHHVIGWEFGSDCSSCNHFLLLPLSDLFGPRLSALLS